MISPYLPLDIVQQVMSHQIKLMWVVASNKARAGAGDWASVRARG